MAWEFLERRAPRRYIILLLASGGFFEKYFLIPFNTASAI
jgi:hypothetical protein